MPIHGDGSDGIGYDSLTMKQQPGPFVKVLALATSFALVAVYVTYRIANAKSEGQAAPAPTAPAPPEPGGAGAPVGPILVGPGRGTVKPGSTPSSAPLMHSSKSMAPLIAPKDLEPAKKPDAAPPAQTAPASK